MYDVGTASGRERLAFDVAAKVADGRNLVEVALDGPREETGVGCLGQPQVTQQVEQRLGTPRLVKREKRPRDDDPQPDEVVGPVVVEHHPVGLDDPPLDSR